MLGIDSTAVELVEGVAAVSLVVDEPEVPTAFFDRQDAICDMLKQTAAAGIALTLELRRPIYQRLAIGMILQDIETLTIRQVN